MPSYNKSMTISFHFSFTNPSMASKTEHLHFLLVPLTSQSHIIPLIDFAKHLAQHGVFVSIITTPLNAIKHKATIDNSNHKIQIIPIKFPSQEAGLPEGSEDLDLMSSPELAKPFFRACLLMQSPLEKLIEELEPKPNCIISTSVISWTKKVAEKFNIPRYNFETISCFTLLCSHRMNRAIANVASDLERFVMPDLPHKIEFTKGQLPRKMMMIGADDFNEIVEQVRQARESAHGTLVNSFDELEPWYINEWRKERGKLWCVGPVSLSSNKDSSSTMKNTVADERYDCLTWLDSMKPNSVIYACFGSVGRISTQQVKEIGLGLEVSGFAFVWVISKQSYSPEVERWLVEEGYEERVGGRGLVVRGWAPQVMILSHPSVGGFLTHCGWNSTLEGISAGVPMITWPMFAEQFFSEKFIVNVLEIGVRVGVEGDDLVKWEQVKGAVEKLMDESDQEGIKRRKRAEELAKMAKNAVEKGGSSYLNVTMLIQDVMNQIQQ